MTEITLEEGWSMMPPTVQQAIAEERNACADLLEALHENLVECMSPQELADIIRYRDDKEDWKATLDVHRMKAAAARALAKGDLAEEFHSDPLVRAALNHAMHGGDLVGSLVLLAKRLTQDLKRYRKAELERALRETRPILIERPKG